MATKHEIEVVISPDGQVKLDVKGMKGPSCLPGVKKLADAVGELKSQDLTSEFYEKPSAGQSQKLG